MSCDTRHVDELLLPIPTSAGGRAPDDAVRVYLGLPGADRPEVWAAVKDEVMSPRSCMGFGRR